MSPGGRGIWSNRWSSVNESSQLPSVSSPLPSFDAGRRPFLPSFESSLASLLLNPLYTFNPSSDRKPSLLFLPPPLHVLVAILSPPISSSTTSYSTPTGLYSLSFASQATLTLFSPHFRSRCTPLRSLTLSSLSCSSSRHGQLRQTTGERGRYTRSS